MTMTDVTPGTGIHSTDSWQAAVGIIPSSPPPRCLLGCLRLFVAAVSMGALLGPEPTCLILSHVPQSAHRKHGTSTIGCKDRAKHCTKSGLDGCYQLQSSASHSS